MTASTATGECCWEGGGAPLATHRCNGQGGTPEGARREGGSLLSAVRRVIDSTHGVMGRDTVHQAEENKVV